MRIRYTSPKCGDCTTFRVKKQSVTMEKYKWYDFPEDLIADLKMEYKLLIEDDCDYYFDKNLFKSTNKKIAFRRTFALGDLLMFIPIINYLNKNTNNKYYLITQKRFIKVFLKFNLFSGIYDFNDVETSFFDKIIYLDGVLEKDHSLNRSERFFHRTKLYARYLHLKIKNFDWNVNLC